MFHLHHSPDAIAICCGSERLSYRELDARADRLARRLGRLGVGPGSLVAVCLPRAAGTPVALLGVLKAGAGFVPVDPAYPPERIAFMLADTRAPVIVTDDARRSRLPAGDAVVVSVDEPDDAGEGVRGRPSAGDPAYVIYTSGSTGVAKGVKITHANLGHYLESMRSALGIAATDCYLHTASFSFSSSVRQLLLPLSCGATVVIATADELRDPLLLFATIRREGVSVVDLVPSYLRVATAILADLEPEARRELLDNRLRLILCASETLHADLPRRWAELAPGARFFNMYGQTETTGIVTLYDIPPQVAPSMEAVPVGRPIAGARVHVLDDAGRPVPAGAAGEIWIGGATVGHGYLDEALTAARFHPDPFEQTADARLYRSGDRGRFRGDGNLELLGRLDDQVKVRGFRIEPAEIEAILNAHPQVLESVVVADTTGTGGKRLVAAVVRRGGGGDDPSFAKRLRDDLKSRLPDYMVPSVVIALETLPRTPGGKLDRKAVLTRPG